MPTPQSLRELVLKYLDIAHLPDADQQEILAGIGENVIKAITIAILGSIPQSAHEKFKELRAAGDNEVLTQFLKQYIQNLEELVEEETRRCVEEFKQIVSSLPVRS